MKPFRIVIIASNGSLYGTFASLTSGTAYAQSAVDLNGTLMAVNPSLNGQIDPPSTRLRPLARDSNDDEP
jgi:hypothetical protein